jgi:hypothetical protein
MQKNLKTQFFFSIFDQVASYLLCIAKGMKEMNVLRIETGRKRGGGQFLGLPIFFPTPSHTLHLIKVSIDSRTRRKCNFGLD